MWAGSGCPIRGASGGIQIGRQVQTASCPREGGSVGLAEFQGSQREGIPPAPQECLTLRSDPEKAASCSFEARVGSGEE